MDKCFGTAFKGITTVQKSHLLRCIIGYRARHMRRSGLPPMRHIMVGLICLLKIHTSRLDLGLLRS